MRVCVFVFAFVLSVLELMPIISCHSVSGMHAYTHKYARTYTHSHAHTHALNGKLTRTDAQTSSAQLVI